MVKRVEVFSKISDARAEQRLRKLFAMGYDVKDLQLADVYTVEDNYGETDTLATMLANPVIQDVRVGQLQGLTPRDFDYAVEVGFLPGVKDNVGDTAREIAEDSSGIKIEGQGVYSSQVMFISGNINDDDARRIGGEFSNPVIQRASVKSVGQFMADGGMDEVAPRVKLHGSPEVTLVDILNSDDLELQRIGKMGVYDHDQELSREDYEQALGDNSDNLLKLGDLIERQGRFFIKSRRGPLAMDLSYMKAVQQYFKAKGRNPTDVEVESIAQTWSEHCRHPKFADPIDEVTDGLYRHFIKGATAEIRRRKGEKDFCVSVFTDNAGGIVFDDEFLVCDKAETHNSPSALDPFGGAITGIVGVNRDPMGFGLGAKPIINCYGFCFGNPDDRRVLFKDKGLKQKMLSTRRIMDGVIEGVNVGGNCSGIPTPQGFVYFDDCYRGKPLVFVRTVGLIPREVDERKMHEKKAEPGDLIVMVGGRVGKDGIHGATFSSEAIDSGSPVGAVQIGDPITQKKMSDALIKEARDRGLYRSITDNGAGGLSCSVAEMAKESGGCHTYLERVPLKYPGLRKDEGWISESQERMTLSVPPENWNELSGLMKSRGVEATVIGEFTNSGRCVVDYNGEHVMDVDLEFLHNGMPARPMRTTFTRKVHEEPNFQCLDDLTGDLCKMLGRQNIASFEFISQQYDHEVQGGSVLKPLQGKGKVNSDATIVRPKLNSNRALVLSQGINPSYSEIDTYDMAACAIDTAVRNAICAGGDLEHLALLDNFCWCSSNDAERLGQLKRACEACYDFATSYGTPFISGKDSMFNDFKGFDENGNPVNISVLPTLLISSIGVMKDARKAVSLDAKKSGHLVYVLGVTDDELGGSEYFAMKGEEQRGEKYIGNKVPRVNPEQNKKTYSALQRAIEEELVASTISVGRGGLGIALAKTAIAGKLGMEVDLALCPMVPNTGCACRDDYPLFSESQGRVVVTIDPVYKSRFEGLMKANQVSFGKVGIVRNDDKFTIKRYAESRFGNAPIDTNIEDLAEAYKSTFRGF